MRTIAVLLALLCSWGVAAADASDGVEYELVDGTIVVFGHTLTPAQPLPDGIECEECGSFHSVSFLRSTLPFAVLLFLLRVRCWFRQFLDNYLDNLL